MNVTFEVKEECECPTQDIIDCAGASIIEDSSNDVDDNYDNVIENDIKEEVKEEQNTEQSDNKISINVGTKEELMTLNGIGESKALAIIAYREKNGSFKTLEDIMNVSGIGEAAFSKIKDYIKL
jgi:competence protein ComEA